MAPSQPKGLPSKPGKSSKAKVGGKARPPAEADLEARLRVVLAPLFGQLKITHQQTLSFKFGHAQLKVDGGAAWSAQGRADILIEYQGRNLAVLELKREGLALSLEDEAQARSYARVVDPMAPIVVVTNGADTWVSNTVTKERLADLPASMDIAALFANAAKLAADDVDDAISTLMGARPEVWMHAVRTVTQGEISHRTASATKPTLRFDPHFHLNRAVSGEVLAALADKKVALLEAPPLGGKSNVLRDIAKLTEEAEDCACLYVDVSEGGILRGIADAIGDALQWDMDPEAARRWLRKLGASSDHRLLVLVDGLDPNRSDRVDELRDLTSRVGDGVSLIIAVDRAGATKLRYQANLRELTRIGEVAAHLKIPQLSDDEFGHALQILKQRGQGAVPGAQHSVELRSTWLLGAYARALTGTGRSGRIPSVVGPDLIDLARNHYLDPNLLALFSKVATAVLADVNGAQRSPSLVLQSLERFVIRTSALEASLSETERRYLADYGYLSAGLDEDRTPLTVIRAPELAASELASLIGRELRQRITEAPDDLAAWLAETASILPLGPIIVAQSIYDSCSPGAGFPVAVLDALLARAPSRRELVVGSKVTGKMPRLGLVTLTLVERGVLEIEARGETFRLDNGDFGFSYEDLEPWLILSHLLSRPSRVMTGGGQNSWEFDAMMAIGAATFVLRSAGRDPDVEAIPVHDLPNGGEFACFTAGVVEPITSAMLAFLNDPKNLEAGPFLRAVRESQIEPLIWRADLAMRQIERSANGTMANWAKNARKILIMDMGRQDC